MSQPVQPWSGPPVTAGLADAVTASDEMVQLLTPEGRRVQHPEFAFTGDDAEIAGYLREMVLARRYDQEGTSLQRQGELGLWPPLLGQEAAQIGSGRAVRDTDMIFPTYREHGVAMLRDVPVANMLGLFRGTSMGDWDIEATRFAQYQIIIGAQTLHATGYAMGIQHDGAVGNPDPERNAAVLAFHGDGASSQGDVNESYVFAASFRAPVVFFCTNNQWAISEPTIRQSRIPLYQRAWGYGFPGIRVDGNDVLAVKVVTDWAMERAREGQGPAFIEAFTYRMGAHTTSDDPSKYRLSEETEAWRRKDPIERVKTYLLGVGAIDEAWLADLDAEADEFGEHVRAACKSLRSEPLAHRFDKVFRVPTAEVEDQRDAHISYLAGFEAAEGSSR
ncbi:MAG: thiamine pyrophosphate-dependent dehydrogenase E1 component subunit alpha [Propionibacterium sp.]|nr:thiamine pyrophosphate-dependent dehydrogenase E1 component subunit alpha [Propionibacterium sp.]